MIRADSGQLKDSFSIDINSIAKPAQEESNSTVTIVAIILTLAALSIIAFIYIEFRNGTLSQRHLGLNMKRVMMENTPKSSSSSTKDDYSLVNNRE